MVLFRWWPGLMGRIAMFASFHESDESKAKPQFKLTRFAFFWICFIGMFAYTWLPGYLIPAIQVFSLLCLFGPNGSGMGKPGSITTKNLFASASQGVGLFAFTFDWQLITSTFVSYFVQSGAPKC